jgi:excisionase family DNA binding protein
MLLNMSQEEFENRIENAVIDALNKYGKDLAIKKIEPEKKGLVRIEQVCATLFVTKPTIYNWIKRGIIKPRKIGNRTLFDMDEILEEIKRNPSKFRNSDKFRGL